jgi:AcrR family transcriptional regulator
MSSVVGKVAEAAASRRTGRPRNPETDATILTAALEEFGEEGYEGMTVEAVANRARVGKATIYRRWSSKDDLIIAAVEWMMTTATEPPHSGNLQEDLIALVGAACRLMRSSMAGAIFPRMAGEVAGRTPLGLRYVKTIIAPRRAVVRGFLAGGVAAGQLRSDIDVELMADSLVGPVILRKILGELDETPEDFPERLVTSMFEGWRAE